MPSLLQVVRSEDVFENSISSVQRCISLGGTGIRQWVESTSGLDALRHCLAQLLRFLREEVEFVRSQVQLRNGRCSAAEGLERMSSTMQGHSSKDVVVENCFHLVYLRFFRL